MSSQLPDDPEPPAAPTGKVDFVQKLYKLLQENEHEAVLCWTSDGSMFSINDTSEFTKIILPLLFRHANFQSFIRQLNKYGFHKVKDYEDGYSTSDKWVFHHPDFNRDNPEALHNVKRKPVGTSGRRMSPPSPTDEAGPSGQQSLGDVMTRMDSLEKELDASRAEVERLELRQQDMGQYLASLERNFADIIAQGQSFDQLPPTLPPSGTGIVPAPLPFSNIPTTWRAEGLRSFGYPSNLSPFASLSQQPSEQPALQQSSQEWDFNWAAFMRPTSTLPPDLFSEVGQYTPTASTSGITPLTSDEQGSFSGQTTPSGEASTSTQQYFGTAGSEIGEGDGNQNTSNPGPYNPF